MEKAANKPIQKFRFERKFVISGLYNRELENLIKLHPAFFTEIFEERQVNNIYFDSFDFRNFKDNVDGSAKRIKVRIRWYGALMGAILKPVLEFKIKNALLGRKEKYQLMDFQLDRNFNINTIGDLLFSSEVPDYIIEFFSTLHPVLLNNYRRKYFMSANENYRITLDTNMKYYAIKDRNNTFTQKYFDKHNTIVEIKYSSDSDNLVNEISSLFPFRLTKSSKYVNGVDRLYGLVI